MAGVEAATLKVAGREAVGAREAYAPGDRAGGGGQDEHVAYLISIDHSKHLAVLEGNAVELEEAGEIERSCLKVRKGLYARPESTSSESRTGAVGRGVSLGQPSNVNFSNVKKVMGDNRAATFMRTTGDT